MEQILLAPQNCPTTHKNRLIIAVKNKNGDINVYTYNAIIQIINYCCLLFFSQRLMIHNHDVATSILAPATSKSALYGVDFLLISEHTVII